MTNLTAPTVVDWLNFSRNVCTEVLDKREKLIGTNENPVQVNELFHHGMSKNNRGRQNKVDRSEGNDGTGEDEIESSNAINENSDDPAKWPWELGTLQNREIMRFKLVDDRKGTTLVPIIQKWVKEGSTIVSDQFRAATTGCQIIDMCIWQ